MTSYGTLTQAECARYVGVSHTAVQMRIRSGKLITQNDDGVTILRASVLRWVREREAAQAKRTANRLTRIAAIERLMQKEQSK